MPRPKVHPSQRQRAAEACNFCRASKKRCSATVPCTACQRRGIGDSCHLTHRPRGFRAAPLPLPHPPRTRASAPAPEQVPGSPSGGDCVRRAVSDGIGMFVHVKLTRQPLVYIGEAASLSFLQLIRDTVTAQIGPSQFSHNEKRDSMLEMEPSAAESSGLGTASCNIDLEGSLLYTRTFEAATGGLLDVFGPTEIEDLLVKTKTDEAQSLNPCQHASIDLVIAIGAQCKSPLEAQQVGPPYFRQAQQRAFAGMLEDPNVDMVRAFLLMAFYMLGHCRRNTAFMYLGIAARAAVALGMHSPHSYTDLKDPVHRLHIWMSLCVLDMLVSSILGRPPATAGLRAELDAAIIGSNSSSATRQSPRTAGLFASYEILTIINESIEALYGRKVSSTITVEPYLSKIEAWSKRLPSFLRNPLTTRGDASTQKAATDSIHVACLYYFAITLVTRPVLISRLTSRPDVSTPSSSPLASACLDAGVYLIQACSEAHKSGLLLGNMCILKALIFAAGLILGFDMFAKKELDYEVEVAFRSAKDVLDFLGVQSPQASHYSEILGLLSNAIMKRRMELSSRPRSKYVGKLFSFNREGHSDHDDSAGNDEALTFDDRINVLRGWDGLELSQWDSFPFFNPRAFGF
ncbi:uncharacterized protein TRIREDRAFT_62244 [Trichoderma reesei QM6a]|uniref:Predicted protein n=1 Tax=Hypocrea jecorina (strain QM6a) TaxID=431241 RepID=G0RKX3_HYPJQ|nr:uncharacterized protein TRIREDRAFT_62244 [Trichoderma reesei QM6a]EGR48297.1 predicted protein [Trichoderma reesei QM6a]